MAINASYVSEMAAALPGQVSDTSKCNIDGACVVSEGGEILVGTAVQVVAVQAVDGHKLIKRMEAEKYPYGVAIRSHWQTVNSQGKMVYEEGGAINVMTSGRVWILSKSRSAPIFGTAVKLDVDGYEKSDGTIAPNWTYAGGFTKWGDTYLVEVQLHQL